MVKYDNRKARTIYYSHNSIKSNDKIECVGCHKTFKAQGMILHHHFPRKFFKNYWYKPWNLVLTCRKCHHLIHLAGALYLKAIVNNKSKTNKNQRKLKIK